MFRTSNTSAERATTAGSRARGIDTKAARIPASAFFWAAGASIVGSLALQATRRRDDATFVGQWAPTFLILGLYSKLTDIGEHE